MRQVFVRLFADMRERYFFTYEVLILCFAEMEESEMLSFEEKNGLFPLDFWLRYAHGLCNENHS